MGDPKATLGSTELEILRYIGDHHPVSVGDVAGHFARTSGQARTTVLTTMERLRRKGHLHRKRSQGVYRYAPKLPKQEFMLGLVKTFVETSLGGSLSPFVAFLSEQGPIAAEDFAALKRLVEDMEGQRKGPRQ